MPTEVGFGSWQRVLSAYAGCSREVREICKNKLPRKSIIMWNKRRWMVIDRAWNRFEKEWDYKVVPA